MMDIAETIANCRTEGECLLCGQPGAQVVEISPFPRAPRVRIVHQDCCEYTLQIVLDPEAGSEPQPWGPEPNITRPLA